MTQETTVTLSSVELAEDFKIQKTFDHKKALRLITLGLFLFSPFAFSKTINVAILDTGFCGVQSAATAFDATGTVNIDCKALSNKHKRNHGTWVAQTLIENINPEIKINLIPIIIFDSLSLQKEAYWKNALNYLKTKSVDYVLIAAGLPFNKLQDVSSLSLPNAPTFVASGRIGNSITHTTKLWPQTLRNSKLFMIGSFIEIPGSKQVLLDNGSLYAKKTQYFFNEIGTKRPWFTGSSYSVALGLAKAINLCHKEYDTKACLEKNEKDLIVYKSTEKIRTY